MMSHHDFYHDFMTFYFSIEKIKKMNTSDSSGDGDSSDSGSALRETASKRVKRDPEKEITKGKGRRD